jgi:AcrR family transcriptional regulator
VFTGVALATSITMPARPKPERKADVLNAIADYLLGAGVSKATLRPAAAAAGTSPRMLIYHFRTKEALMVAALREVRRREFAMLAGQLGRFRRKPTDRLMRDLWKWYAAPRRAPYLRVFFEAWGMSLRRPYLRDGFLAHVRKDLLPLAEQALMARGYPERDARAVATFMIGAFRGLLIDLVANPEDRERLADAMEIFILVTQVMQAKGPLAARAVLGQRTARRSPRPNRRRAPRSE